MEENQLLGRTLPPPGATPSLITVMYCRGRRSAEKQHDWITRRLAGERDADKFVIAAGWPVRDR